MRLARACKPGRSGACRRRRRIARRSPPSRSSSPARAHASDPRLAVEALGLDSPIRSASRPASTRTPRFAGAMLKLGFGFVEVGTLTPRPQARQSAPAPVPPRRGRGGHQPLRLQQRGLRGAPRARLGAPARGAGRRQCRRQQGRGRPDRRLRPRRQDLRRRSPTISPSTSPRPTRRACATCSGARRSTSCAPAVVGARDETEPRRPLLVKIAPDLDAAGTRRHCRRGAEPPRSTASSSPTPRSRGPRRSSRRTARKAAACRAGRCSSPRRGCSPAPISLPAARCR